MSILKLITLRCDLQTLGSTEGSIFSPLQNNIDFFAISVISYLWMRRQEIMSPIFLATYK